MPLCIKCKHIHLPHLHPNDEKTGRPRAPNTCLIRHHASFEDLIIAANNGCEVCQYFKPFVEHAVSKRNRSVQQAESQSSSRASYGASHCDPFGAVNRRNSRSSWVFSDTDSAASHHRYYVDNGRLYYILHEKEAKYSLYMADECSEYRRFEEVREQIDAEATAESNMGGFDSGQLLALTSYAASPLNGAGGDSRSSAKLQSNSHHHMEALQWALTLHEQETGADQLWMTVHNEEYTEAMGADINTATCSVTLSIGSISNYRLEEAPTFCLDGVQGYSIYDIANKFPSIWKYRSHDLTLPSDTPHFNRHAVLEFYQHRHASFDTVPKISTRHVEAHANCAEVFGLARSWYSQCTDLHDKSCELKSSTDTPSRLIDVGNDQNPSIRLRLTCDEQEKRIKYAILSHCWGLDDAAVSKLTVKNLSEYRTAIDPEMLSRNFTDAVTVTRAMGLRYVWIDAICIIQDCQEDWIREAANMAEYYRGAEMTIAAFSSTGAGECFLRERDTLLNPPRIDTDDGPLFLRPPLPSAVGVTGPDSYTNLRQPIPQQPLNERAWALQERLFSRRILYFCKEQLIWQCRRTFFSEDGQISPKVAGRTTCEAQDIVDVLDFAQTRTLGSGGEKQTLAPSVRSTQWFALLSAFTQRKLTYDTDRLPAIAGLAREVHKLTKMPYRAGIWLGSSSRTQGLMWTVKSAKQARKAENTCPSWSWASICAEIEHPLVGDDHIVSMPLLDPVFGEMSTVLGGCDVFGGVKSGRISVKAWIHTYAGVRSHQDLLRDAETFDWGERWNSQKSADPSSPDSDPLAKFDIEMPDDLWSRSELGQTPSSRSFAIAFMCHTNTWMADDVESTSLANTQFRQQHFLLLECIDSDAVNRYRRVGIAQTEGGTVMRIDKDHGWQHRTVIIV